MKNWREAAEDEALRKQALEQESIVQEAADREAARVSAEQQAQSENQRIEALRVERLRLFESLGIPEKLEQINREVWKGLGKILFRRDHIRPDAEQLVELDFTLATEADIGIATQPILEKKYGKYYTTHKGYNMGGDFFYTEEHVGWHDVETGRTITGWQYIMGHGLDPGAKHLPLRIGFWSGIDSDMGRVAVVDEFKRLDIPEVNLPYGWEVYRGWLAIAGRPLVREPDRNPYPFGNGVAVSFPLEGFDRDLAGGIIDGLLVQSCAARLPYVDQWAVMRPSVDARIREIEKKIGTKIPQEQRGFLSRFIGKG